MISFSGVEIDQERREIRRDGKLVPVQPQVFDLLIYIIDNRERVVSRDDLIEHVWNGRIVSESTLASRINAARVAVGDNGTDQRLIRTVRGRGLRFVGNPTQTERQQTADKSPVHRYEYVDLYLPHTTGAESDSILSLLSDELSEQLAAAFSLRVFYSIKLEEAPADPVRTGYSLSSNIRRIGDRAKLSVKLSSVGSERLIWAEVFDVCAIGWSKNRSLATDTIVNRVFADIADDRTRLAREQTPDSVDAADLSYQARHLIRTKNPKDNFAAEKLLIRSVELQPDHYSGCFSLAYLYLIRASSVWTKSVAEALEDGRAAASVAAFIAPNASAPREILACYAAYQRQFSAALEYAELACKLEPTNSVANTVRALILSFTEQTEEALDILQFANKTNAGRKNDFFLNTGRALFINGDYDLAIPKLEMYTALAPAADLAQLFLGNCYFAVGLNDKARTCVKTHLSLCPHTTIERTTHVTPYPDATLASFHSFLRIHNVPEA
jgi:DNA-binding winged helix-turn-helix (wHTH) protein/tetratricopeptide (TPR) repeat protein